MFDIQDIDSELQRLIYERAGFAHYRLVDPQTKVVYDYRDGALIPTGGHCYDVWKRDGVCMNCSTSRAAALHRQIIKLEFFEGKVFLILSVPVALAGQELVVELVNDVSESMIVYTDDHSKQNDVMNLIDGFNELISRDSFSGLYNKRSAEERLEREIAEGRRLTAALVDIDCFKDVNDRFGHVAGDDVILFLSDLFRSESEGVGWASRIGGDEFLLVYYETSRAEVLARCEKILKKIDAKRIEKDGAAFGISVSLGVAESSEGEDFRVFLDRVDREMYAEKRRKRAK